MKRSLTDSTPRVDRVGVEVVLENVLPLDRFGRDGAREEEALRILRMADAHVPIGVDHVVLGEDTVRGDKVVEELGIHGRGEVWRRNSACGKPAMDEDDIRLDLRNRAELDRWADKLRVPRDEFRRAAEHAGPRLGDIRQHLIGGFTAAGPTS